MRQEICFTNDQLADFNKFSGLDLDLILFSLFLTIPVIINSQINKCTRLGLIYEMVIMFRLIVPT